MICCLNPHCSQENPPCPDGMKFCSGCKTELLLLSDRYRPTKRLGKGGFGVTYLAEDREMFGSYCVIKQLINNDVQAKVWFEREALKLKELGSQSSQIPSLLAYSSDSKYLYLVQEFISGQDLNKYLAKQGAFQEEQVKDFLSAILPVLSLIHEKKIIHRDIKLDNIMRCDDGQIVLIDFGTAKQLSGNNTPSPGTAIGTWGYVPPEQMMKGIVKPASDLYSLGAACFHLLTGIHPNTAFKSNGYEWTKNWRQYLKQPISKDFGKIIDKLLKHEYKKRYQSAGEVLQRIVPVKPKRNANPPLFLTSILLLSIVSLYFILKGHIAKRDSDYYALGQKLIEINEKGAIDAFSEAIKLNPNNPDAFIYRGFSKMRAKTIKVL